MKGKIITAVVVLMCLALVAQSALAQPQGRGPRQGRGPGQGGQARGGMMGRGGGMYEGLDLTEEQQAKIDKLMEEARNADSPEARRELFGQMREKMQAILTPEQREKMAQRREEMSQRFSGRSGREGDRPGGPGQRPGQNTASRARPMGPIQILDGLLRRLDLNKEQQAKITKIRADALKKLFKDVKAVLTKEQNTKLAEDQKRVRTAQQRRSTTEGRPGAGGPPREGGSRRGGGDREGGSRGRTRGEGDRDRGN